MKNLVPELSRRLAVAFPVTAMLALALLLSGCAFITTPPTSLQDFTPAYQPSNVFRRYPVFPPQIQRVALLPLTLASDTADLESGAQTLEPEVFAELEKTKRFEVISVTSERLRQWTGQRAWRSDQPLPADFFVRLREATGCDCVLFCQLTRYKPYQPLAIGWKFTLVETAKGISPTTDFNPQIAWSADELLDAGDPSVANAARRYYALHLHADMPASDASTMISSPMRFGQYTLGTLFATLPERQFIVK